jgi:hypothetical protein
MGASSSTINKTGASDATGRPSVGSWAGRSDGVTLPHIPARA